MSLKILNIMLCVMFVNILGNCALGSCSQNGDGFTENSSNNNSENVGNIPQRLPLTFGPETFDKLKSDPNFIAAYGRIPTFKSSEEREQWIGTLGKVMDQVDANFEQEMSKYFYPNGPFTSCGITIDGVIEVGVGVNKTVEKSLMDKIYQILDSKANRMGINEVPVVFVHRDLAVPLVEPAVEETANLSASEDSSNINNSNGNKSSKTNSAPGFGLLGVLTCLCGGWKLMKK